MRMVFLLFLVLQYFYDQYLQQDMTAADALASATCERDKTEERERPRESENEEGRKR